MLQINTIKTYNNCNLIEFEQNNKLYYQIDFGDMQYNVLVIPVNQAYNKTKVKEIAIHYYEQNKLQYMSKYIKTFADELDYDDV